MHRRPIVLISRGRPSADVCEEGGDSCYEPRWGTVALSRRRGRGRGPGPLIAGLVPVYSRPGWVCRVGTSLVGEGGRLAGARLTQAFVALVFGVWVAGGLPRIGVRRSRASVWRRTRTRDVCRGRGDRVVGGGGPTCRRRLPGRDGCGRSGATGRTGDLVAIGDFCRVPFAKPAVNDTEKPETHPEYGAAISTSDLQLGRDHTGVLKIRWDP